jgi:hypothetical protein
MPGQHCWLIGVATRPNTHQRPVYALRLQRLRAGSGWRSAPGGRSAQAAAITVKRLGQGWTAVPHRPANYTTLDVVETNDAGGREKVIADAKSLVDEHFEKVRRALKEMARTLKLEPLGLLQTLVGTLLERPLVTQSGRRWCYHDQQVRLR